MFEKKSDAQEQEKMRIMEEIGLDIAMKDRELSKDPHIVKREFARDHLRYATIAKYQAITQQNIE